MSFCERLRERREALKMSRQELADKINVGASAIGNYETGVSHPKPEILYRIFEALSVDPNFLYQDEFTHIKKAPDIEEPGVRLYKQLDEIDKASACGYMEALLNAEKYKQDGEKMA